MHGGRIALLRILCHWCQLLRGEGKLLLVLKDPGSHIVVEISLSESICNCSWCIISDCWKYLVDLDFDLITFYGLIGLLHVCGDSNSGYVS